MNTTEDATAASPAFTSWSEPTLYLSCSTWAVFGAGLTAEEALEAGVEAVDGEDLDVREKEREAFRAARRIMRVSAPDLDALEEALDGAFSRSNGPIVGLDETLEALRSAPRVPAPFVFAALVGSQALARTIEGLTPAVRVLSERFIAENPGEGYGVEDLDQMVADELADGVPVLIQAAGELAAFKAWREFGWSTGLDTWRAAFPAPEGVDPVAEFVEAEERAKAAAEAERAAREATEKESRVGERRQREAEERDREDARDAEMAARDPLPEGLPARFADTKHRVGLWGHVGAAMWTLSAEALGRVARFVDAELSGAPAFPMTVYLVADAATTGLEIVERTAEAARKRLEVYMHALYQHSDRENTEDAFVASAMKAHSIVPIVVDRRESGPAILRAVMKVDLATAERVWAYLLGEDAPDGAPDDAGLAEDIDTPAGFEDDDGDAMGAT